MSDHPWESWVAAAREINEIRDALVAALGGPDVVPPGTTPLDMVAALAQTNRFLHRKAIELRAERDYASREGDPHRHPGQFGARMCHDHDDFGYHCHDLAARPGVEPGRMYR